MKKAFLILVVSVFFKVLNAQEHTGDNKQIELEEVVVSSVRVERYSATVNSNLNEKQIKWNNSTKNIPSIISRLPSVVSYTEGGTSVGNTSFRIRGTDANRINITLNGMPLNNPESQEVYWVNLPDLSSSLKNIQIQRGVGTSTSGTASFGASVSMQTLGAKDKAYADFSTAYGHYNTLLLSASAGSGVLKNGLSVNAKYSYTKSDGYIRNGKVNHKNLFAGLSHYSKNQMINLVYINGIQHTGITWEGVSPENKIIDRQYNSAGMYTDDEGKTQFYDNETDNYYSHVTQLQYARLLGDRFNINFNMAWTNGYGYYENYKTNQKFEKFGLGSQIIDSEEYFSSDLIRRKLMDNNLHFANINFMAKLKVVNVSLNSSYTHFNGDHYGKLLWIKYNNNIKEGYEWYLNNSVKKELSNNLKLEKHINKLALSAELQVRYVDYRLDGVDDDLLTLASNNYYTFYNPKIGGIYSINKLNQVYASFGISNREPMRIDLKESVKGTSNRIIKTERLFDYEFGYRYIKPSISIFANLYYMKYNNQLVQSGRLSDVGYKYQENVPDSYRGGVELETRLNFLSWLQVDANLTLSRNKIKNYTAYYDVYNDKGKFIRQESEVFQSTTISYSPSSIASLVLMFKPLKARDLHLSLINKYVGSMFYDNTSNPENKLPSYIVNDFQASYTIKIKSVSKVELQLIVNNITNKKYDANAIVETYKLEDGSKTYYRALFPQATTNVMGRVNIIF